MPKKLPTERCICCAKWKSNRNVLCPTCRIKWTYDTSWVYKTRKSLRPITLSAWIEDQQLSRAARIRALVRAFQ